MSRDDQERAAVDELVAGIEPGDDLEASHREQALTWVRSGQPLYRPLGADPHLVSYFPIVDPVARTVLLVHHRKADLWLPPGGHVEIDEHPHWTVERECREELGLAARFRWPDPRFVTVTPTRGPASHVDVSLWFVLVGSLGDRLDPDPVEFHAVRWFDLDDTDWSSGYDPHFARFAAKLRPLL